MTRRKVCTFSTDTTIVATYIVHVSNNVTFFPSIFYPWLVESVDTNLQIWRTDYILKITEILLFHPTIRILYKL